MTLCLFGGEGRTDDDQTLAALEVDYTPPAVAVQVLLGLLATLDDLGVVFAPRRALDPAAGSGCWGRARAVLGSWWPGVDLVGVEPRLSEGANLAEAYDRPLGLDFETFVVCARGRDRGRRDDHGALLGREPAFDLVATNPPFSAFTGERPSCEPARQRRTRPTASTVQLPPLPTALRRWSPAAVPGTYPIDVALVDEIRGRYL